jgi:RNA polymerase sigma-70 factor (ECF subfamily)
MPEPLLSELQDGQARFLTLVEQVRPELHRYCARMTGSIADGEDVVQDALARAYCELSEMKEIPALRPWLFRIAHNRAIDYLRRYERRMGEPLDDAFDLPGDSVLEPENAALRDDAVRTAISRFLELPAAQRSCVILKDVLEHSLEEIGAMLQLSIPAVKSALSRGRLRLRELSKVPEPANALRSVSPALIRYADLFNARDWDGVRAMLVEDVKLDLVHRLKITGPPVGAIYLTNYAAASDWHLVPAWLDGREVLAVFRQPSDARPTYFIELAISGDRIAVIRDFRYVPYITREAAIRLAK